MLSKQTCTQFDEKLRHISPVQLRRLRKLALLLLVAVSAGCAKEAPAPAIVSTAAAPAPAAAAPAAAQPLKKGAPATAPAKTDTKAPAPAPNQSVLNVTSRQAAMPVPKPSTAKVLSSWREINGKRFHLASTMEILADKTFRWEYEGIPMTGSYKKSANNYDLTVQTAFGQPIEIIQSASGNGLKMVSQTLKAQTDSSGNLNLFASGAKDAAVVFRPGKIDEIGPASVTAEEKPLVGEFIGRAKMDGVGVTDEAQQEQVLERLQNMNLVLRADNTFRIDMIVRFSGRWHVDKTKLYLEVPMAFDIMQAGQGAGKFLIFDISSENRVLVTKRDEPPVQMVFLRK